MKAPLLGVLALLFCSHSFACLQQESESNNTEGTADGALCSGTAVAASIGSSSDVDWYYFDTTATGGY